MSVCLSVLLQKDGQTDFFVTRRYSVETAKRIPKLLLASSRHTAVIVTSQTLRQYSEFRRVPLDRGRGMQGPRGMKKSLFSFNVSLNLRNNTRCGRSYLLWNANKNP